MLPRLNEARNMDAREEFLSGVLAFENALRSINFRAEDVTVLLSEKNGRALEHILTRDQYLFASAQRDDRYSTPKADKHIREFQVAGLKFQYRVKPIKLPSGDII